MIKFLKRKIGGFDYIESRAISFVESIDGDRKQHLPVHIRNTMDTLSENARNYLMKKLGLELKNVMGLFYGHTEAVDKF